MIYFIRHGSTDWNDHKNDEGNVDPKCQGRCDIPLNKLGRLQAIALNKKLVNIKFDKIFCSPLLRAKQTLDILYNSKSQVTFDNRLIERDFGEFEGLGRTEFDFKSFWSSNAPQNYLTAEPLDEFIARVYDFFDQFKKSSQENILIVSHGGVGMVAMSYFYGLPPQGDYTTYLIENGSIKKFDYTTLTKSNN